MSLLTECTCGHLRGYHLSVGCVGEYRGMRDDQTLCTCPAFTKPCSCGACTKEAA